MEAKQSIVKFLLSEVAKWEEKEELGYTTHNDANVPIISGDAPATSPVDKWLSSVHHSFASSPYAYLHMEFGALPMADPPADWVFTARPSRDHTPYSTSSEEEEIVRRPLPTVDLHPNCDDVNLSTNTAQSSNDSPRGLPMVDLRLDQPEDNHSTGDHQTVEQDSAYSSTSDIAGNQTNELLACLLGNRPAIQGETGRRGGEQQREQCLHLFKQAVEKTKVDVKVEIVVPVGTLNRRFGARTSRATW